MKKIITLFFFFQVSVCIQTIGQDLKSGLIAYYPLNGNANDESGNNNHGVVNGAILTYGRDGSPNTAYYFNGNNSYIDLQQNFIKDIDFTMSLWFKTDYNGKINPLISTRHRESSFSHTLVIENGLLELSLDGPGYFKLFQGKKYVNDNSWHFVVVTKKSTNFNIYIDGSIVQSGSGNISTDNSALHIGHHGAWNSYFKGSIDDIRFYKRTINESEISDLYRNLINKNEPSTPTVNINSPNGNVDIFDPISKIDLFGLESCANAKVLSSADEKFLLVQQTGTIFEVYETEKWKSIGTFSIPNKKSISLAYSYFTSDRIYLSINDSDRETYFNVSIYGGEVDEIKCKKAPRGCLGNNQSVSNYYYNSSKYQFDINDFRLFFKRLNSCFIEITKQNPEKVAYSSSVNGSIDDCIMFLSKYPNSDFKEKVETAMLAKAKNLDGLGDLCKKHSSICTKAEKVAFDLVKNASKADKQKFLSIFPSGANFQAIKAQIDKIEDEEKMKLETEKRKQEEERIRQEQEKKQIAAEQQKRKEVQKAEQDRIAKKEQERKQKIQSNSNSSLWSLGSKVCNEINGGIVVGVINQWNENKSSALIKILSAPSGSKYEGEKLYEDATVWIATSGKGWHGCLDDEFEKASTQKTDIKAGTGISSGNNDNTESSGKRGTAAVASKFAKLFMKNVYRDCNDDSDKQGFYSRILSWETVDWQVQEGYCYAVRVEFGWNYGAMKVREYKGVIHFEESGCGSGFMVEEKKELGSAIVTEYSLRSLCAPIDKEIRERVNQHFKGNFKWSMGSGDCIEE